MAWIIETDSTNRPFSVCLQDANNSCSAASIAMVRFMLTGRRAPEMLGRWAVEVGRGGRLGMRDWGQVGVNLDEIANGLREAGLRSTQHIPGRYFLTSRCSQFTPGLIIAYWNNGGGHATICLGQIPNTDRILILDPGYHLQEVPINTLPQYNPVHPHAGQNNGRFTDCFLCRR